MSTLQSLFMPETVALNELDPTEEEVQQLLAKVADATPEAQALFVSRILQGFVTKSSAKLAIDVVKAAQAQNPKLKAPAKPIPIRDAKPLPWTGLGRITLSDPFDPIEGWQHFGHDTYWRILYFEMLPILEQILIHPNMPSSPKFTKKVMTSNTLLAKAIIEVLEKHFDYQP